MRVIPGSAHSSVLLHVPHSSRVIPEWVRERILLSDVQLEAEIHRMRDSYTDAIAATAAEQAQIRPHSFLNELARQVIDPERFPDDREAMAKIGHGAVYLKTSQLKPLRENDPVHIAELLDRYFHPYAHQVTDEVETILDSARSCNRARRSLLPTRGVAVRNIRQSPTVDLPRGRRVSHAIGAPRCCTWRIQRLRHRHQHTLRRDVRSTEVLWE